MATYKQISDPIISCPINPVHRLKKSKLQIHLTKCRKDNLSLEMKTCPYNAQHMVHAVDYALHTSTCVDRAIVDRQIINRCDEGHHGTIAVPSYNNINAPSEYWDDDPVSVFPAPGYDPNITLASKNVFRDMAHLKPADKKEFYKKLFLQGEIETPPPIAPQRVSPVPSRNLNRHPNDMSGAAFGLNTVLGRGQASNGQRRRLAANFSNMTTPTRTPSVSSPSPLPPVGRSRGILDVVRIKPGSQHQG